MTNGNKKLPARTIERLVLYKRLLMEKEQSGSHAIFSYELAELAHNTSAQVRRDFMMIGQEGCPHKGYPINRLIKRISKILGCHIQSAVLVGVGNLGRALLSYFTYRQTGISLVAAFDSDPLKSGRVISGCHVYALEDFPEKLKELKIKVGIITVPADQAQNVAEQMVKNGVTGILNFAPVPLTLPSNVCSERIDIAGALEKLIYFAEEKRV